VRAGIALETFDKSPFLILFQETSRIGTTLADTEGVARAESECLRLRTGEDRSLGVLVATQNEFRRYPRIACPKGTILAWQTGHQRVVSAVDNAGLGGLYILTPEPPVPGTFIQLLLDVPAGEVRATAVVQRSEPKEGMAVKFVGMQQEYRSRFFRWLKRLSS